MCTKCGNINEISLRERTFTCECGVKEDRDIHSAQNMVWFYKKNIGEGLTEFTPVELKKLVSKALKQEDAISLV